MTCHDSRHLAMEAGEAGADYVAFGAFYPTTTKASHHRPGPVDPLLVVDPVRDPLRRHRRHHAGQCAGRWSRPAPISWRLRSVWSTDDPAAAVKAFQEVLAGRHRGLEPGSSFSGQQEVRWMPAQARHDEVIRIACRPCFSVCASWMAWPWMSLLK